MNSASMERAAVAAAAPGPAAAAGRRSGVLAWIPLLLAFGVLAFLALPRVRANTHLLGAFAGVGGGLVVWYVLLRVLAARHGRALTVEPVAPVRQHYIQACVQLVLYAYWGWFWVVDGARPIYVQAPLIVAQLCYLYAFDALFAWSRGQAWRFASGPTPIVLSTNLFIWFKDDWFVWQFAMITAGLLGKAFVKWTKEGRKTHVFNPSGFGLACAASVLILTGATDVTWAKPLATTIEVKHIFVVIFVLGLVVQHFFAVTLMTFAAALAMVACNVGYTQLTGVYLFGSTNLPAAAFLGLHLLMTDPSTSPRTNVGRALFGLGYGLGYVIAFELLGRVGAPELYAKLYPVPILNCTVQVLDRVARTGAIGRLNRRWETGLPARATNWIHMALWSAVFVVMLGTGYVEGPHPGDSIAFWKRAVAEQRHEAARKLVMVAGSQAVGQDSAAAYNELGILSLTSGLDAASEQTRHNSAGRWFAEAAQRGSVEAAENLVMHFLFYSVRRSDDDLARALAALERAVVQRGDPRAAFLLGVAIETGVGVEPNPQQALALYRRCPKGDVFAAKGIARLGLARGALIDLSSVGPVLAASAARGDGESCYYLAYMHLDGKGVGQDGDAARRLLQRAAELGFEPAKQAAGLEPPPAFAPPRRKFMAHPAWATAFPVADG